MTTVPRLEPRDVSTTLNYYAPVGTEAPYQYVAMEPPPGKSADNLGKDRREVVINDIRGREKDFSLDKNGFEFSEWPSAEKEFDDEERIRKQYYPEVEELLKKVTGAERVCVLNHCIRRSCDNSGDPACTRPLECVHLDYTFDTSVRLVNEKFPAEAERLLKGRLRVMGLWRPIRYPVVQHPLSVSDWNYVDGGDFVSVTRIYPGSDGSNTGYVFRYNPAHKWYYLSDQTPDEVTVIKLYDSAVDKAKCSPHSAFVDSSIPKEAPERVSIEVRALVFDSE